MKRLPRQWPTRSAIRRLFRFKAASSDSKLFVDTRGSDFGSGSAASPFATIHRALDCIAHQRRSNGPADWTVEISAGVHRMDSPARIDSRVADGSSRITIRGHQGATILTGRRPVTATPVDPDDPLLILAGRDARRGALLAIGVPPRTAVPLDLGTLGFRLTMPHAPPMAFCNGERLDWARVPHRPETDGIGMLEASGRGSPPTVTLEIDPRIVEQISSEPHLWVEFVFDEPWQWFRAKVTALDPRKGRVATDLRFDSGKPRARVDRVRFVNAVGNMGPGQCVIDPPHRRIVFSPPTDSVEGLVSCELCTNPAPLIHIVDATNVRIEGLALRGGLASGIVVENSTSVDISDCIVSDFGFGGIDLSGRRLRVSGCDVHDVGTIGIWLSAGNPETLEPGESFVSGCTVQHWSNWKPIYEPGVRINGVGTLVDSCRIAHGPHLAIEADGNDHRIQRNVFTDVAKEFVDMGAVYLNLGQFPLKRGIRIQANVFHDIGGENDLNHAVYADNSTYGVSVRRNLFLRIISSSGSGAAVYSNGTSDMVVDENLFVECTTPLDLCFYLADWGSHLIERYEIARAQALSALHDPHLPHHRRYAQLERLSEESLVFPFSNRFVRNVIWNPTVKLAYGPWRVRFGPADLVDTSGNTVSTEDPVNIHAKSCPLASLIAGKSAASAIADIEAAIGDWPTTCTSLGLVEVETGEEAPRHAGGFVGPGKIDGGGWIV